MKLYCTFIYTWLTCCLKAAVVRVYKTGFSAEFTGNTKTANQAYRDGDIFAPVKITQHLYKYRDAKKTIESKGFSEHIYTEEFGKILEVECPLKLGNWF